MTERVKYPPIVYGLGASLGAFVTGCCIGMTGPQDHGIREESSFTNNSWGLGVWWVRACLPLSALGFCKVAALNIERRGQMKTLKTSAIVFFIAVLLYLVFFWKDEGREDFELLFVYRIILGLGCGLASTAFPLYAGEIAQKELRGAVGSFFYFQLALGVLASYCFLVFSGYVWISAFGLLISLIFISSVHLKPDSPLYLMKIGEEDAAKGTLVKLRGEDYDVKNELDLMRAMVQKSKQSNATLLERFESPANMRALFICVGLMFLQQFSGIHAVLLATAPTFRRALNDFDIRYSVVLVEAVQVLGALVAMFLVDLAGRRLLLLISAASMTILMLALAVFFTIGETGWAPLIVQCLFVFMFSFGFGPVPWIMLGEVFALNIKENTAFLVVGSFWLFHYLNSDTFVIARSASGANNIGFSFWLFFSVLVLSVLFVFFFVPETKQKSFQEVEEMMLKLSSTNQNA